MSRPIFLTAEWRHLLILNYRVDPALLAPLVPAGTTLDTFGGETLISLVGFRFLDTRVRGLPIPGHRDFDEINLRFYVKRQMPDGTIRRGVTFVREIVPRPLIALVARWLYDEPYVTRPMRHEVGGVETGYQFREGGEWRGLAARPEGAPILATDDPLAGFITEHYWGYTRRSAGRTSEYEVRHPVWRVRMAGGARLLPGTSASYGPLFHGTLDAPPHSALVAEGSPVSVHSGVDL